MNPVVTLPACILAIAVTVSTAAAQRAERQPKQGASGAEAQQLVPVARFKNQVTGVTVTENGRIFVSFPRWTEDVPISVAEVMQDGSVRPYPSDEWNAWRNSRMTELSSKDHFVCVQSVVADGRGS